MPPAHRGILYRLLPRLTLAPHSFVCAQIVFFLARSIYPQFFPFFESLPDFSRIQFTKNCPTRLDKRQKLYYNKENCFIGGILQWLL